MVDPDLTMIAASLRRVRTGIACLAGGSLFFFFLTAGIGLSQRKPAPAVIGIGGAAAVSSLIALGFFWHYAQIESVPVYRVLRDSPEEIVWVYEGSTRYRVNSVPTSTECWVGIHLKNGKGLQLRSVHPADVPAVLETIQRRAPQAVMGYSEAIAQQYLKDPRSLITETAPPESR